MKKFNSFKTFLLVALLAATGAAWGQNYHPLAFGQMGYYADSNWYKDYVGLNVLCTAPTSIAGSLLYTTPGGIGTGAWGGVVTTPLVNVPCKLAPTADSCACTPGGITAGWFTGTIAVILRGPIAAPCEFGAKALAAQNGGAVACVIVNEYTGEGPVGMAAGASGGTVTIPVFMIGNIPGEAMIAQLMASTPVTMTITPWGVSAANDLGFVPGNSVAAWHDYAIPADQLTSPTPTPYKGLDGAFIANYGTNTATNAKVHSTLSFTPTGGSATVLRADSTDALASFPTTDSIWAMFEHNLYDVTASGTGRFDLTYNITSATTDDVPANNTLTTSFYASDSVYSKGTYDFVNKVPLSTFPTGVTGDFVWGNMYYVNHGGAALSAIQFAENNGFTGSFQPDGSALLMVFKWVDGSNGQPSNGIVEDGELNIISTANYAYQETDSSEIVMKTPPLGQSGGLGDSLTGTYNGGIFLSDNSWYYVAVDVQNGMSLYCDGQTDPYPRVYGRAKNASSFYDYSNLGNDADFAPGPSAIFGNPPQPENPIGVAAANTAGAATGFVGVSTLDSFNYNGMKGLIPSVALTVIATPPPRNTAAVNSVTNGSELTIFPIPTSDNLNVSLNLTEKASTVTYTILDGVARFVSKETHNNVQNENFAIPTSGLRSGSYFLIVTANGKAMSRKFIVVK